MTKDELMREVKEALEHHNKSRAKALLKDIEKLEKEKKND